MNDLTILARALRHSRRTFLLRTAGTVAFPLSLAACGGGGDYDNTQGAGTGAGTGGTGTGTTTPIVALTTSKAKGTFVLPAGATVTVASVQNAFGSSAPASDGSFDFTSVAESEMFAIAVGPGGKMVLSGLLQAGSANYTTQLSARSTAVCLAYTVLGVGVYLPSTQEQYLAAIQASPTLSVLEAAVSAALVARGEGWLDLTDPALKSALSAMQTALSPTALSSSTSMADRAHSESLAASGSDGRVTTEGMVIDKTARTSGIQITGDGVATITISNAYRRRSYAYVNRVSYQDTYTGAITDSPATVGIQPMKIDGTKGITNTLVTLAQLFAGVNDFYDPVVYPDIPTPIAPASAALTTYQVTSVGLGVSYGDLASLTADQHTGLRQVIAETVVFDIVVPIFCGILIPIAAAPIAAFIPTFGVSRLKDLITTLAASDDIFLNKIVAANRPLNEVLWDTLLTIVGSEQFKDALLGFFQDCIDALSAVSALPATNVVNIGAKALLDAISALDLSAQAFDLVVTGLSYAFSDLADQFTIDVTKSDVRLNPLNPTLDPAVLTQTNFTLSVVDSELTAADLSYQWNCTCLFGDISDGAQTNRTNGNSFPSSSGNIAYTPRGNAKGGDTELVSGTIYKGHVLTPGMQGSRLPIGTAFSTITYNAVISPSPVQLLVNTEQVFTAEMSATVLASGTALNYVWTVSGGGTVGGAATLTTSTPSVTYKAGPTATTDTLALVVTTLSGTVVTRASATIGVLGSVAAGIAPQNPQVPRSTVLNFVVSSAAGSFPSGTTFKWVLTHTPDLFGRPQDIGASGGGTIGVNVAVLPSGVSPGASVTVVTTSPTIGFAANPFGPEAFADTFFWNPSLTLTVSVLGAGGSVLTTSSTTIYTQVPTSITLP